MSQHTPDAWIERTEAFPPTAGCRPERDDPAELCPHSNCPDDGCVICQFEESARFQLSAPSVI